MRIQKLKKIVYIFLLLTEFTAFSQSNDIIQTLNRESDTAAYKRLIAYTILKYNFNYVIFDSKVSKDLLNWANEHNDDNVKLESIYWTTLDDRNNVEDNIKILLNAVKFAQDIESPIQEANCYVLLASNYEKKNQKIKAFEYYLKGTELFELQGFDNIPFLYYRILKYGEFLYAQQEYTDALKWLFIAQKYCNYQDLQAKMHINNGIALCYNKMNKNKESIIYNLNALKVAEKNNNVNWIGILSSNLAANYITLKEYTKAVPYLLTRIKISNNSLTKKFSSEINDLMEGQIRLAHCYINLNELNLAFNLLSQTDSLIYKHGSLPTKINYNLQYATYYKLKKDANREVYYFRICEQLKDSLFNINFGTQYINDRVKLEAERNLEKVEQINERKKTGDFKRNITILLLLLFTLTGIIIFYNFSRSNKQKQQLLKLENDKLEQEKIIKQTEFLNIEQQQRLLLLENEKLEQEKNIKENELYTTKQKLQEFTNYIIEKNNLIEQIQNELTQKQTTETAKQKNEVDIEKINQLSNLTILTEDDWIKFKLLFESAFPKFITSLNINYPQLTKTELRFICLSKLKLPTKDLANMLAISPTSVHQLKYRLNYKLNENGLNISQLLD